MKRDFIDLNESPFLAYELLDIERYTNNTILNIRERALPLMTSRGCPYRCTYCYTKSFNRSKWRAMKASKVIEYTRELALRFKLSGIHLFDDEFFIDRNRVEEICQRLLSEKLGLHFLNANIRINEILGYEMEFLHHLKRAGFERLLVGVESGSEEILQKVQKGITVSESLEANRKLKEAGIKPFYNFLMGFPFERTHHVKKTLWLMNRLLTENPDALHYGGTFYTPYPGTPLYDLCLRERIPLPGSLTDWIGYLDSDRYLSSFPRKEQRFFRKAFLIASRIDHKSLLDSIRSADKSKIKYWLTCLYSWIIRLRVRSNFYFGMWELSALQYVRRKREHPPIKYR